MAQLPPGYLNSVISLGTRDSAGDFVPLGTGFLYGHKAKDGLARLFLVTNRHVVQKAEITAVRLNLGGGFSVLNLADVVVSTEWQCHESEDVATIPGNAKGPLMIERRPQELDIFLEEGSAITADECKNISEGNGVFVLGFPMGLVGDSRNYTTVRGGTIARIQDWQNNEVSTFLIDAAVFPGNSGGPVVIQAEVASVGKTPRIKRALLIGMISKYITYSDTAISQQTGDARITFVENSGLAVVVPIQVIQEFIESTYAEFGDSRGDGSGVGQPGS